MGHWSEALGGTTLRKVVAVPITPVRLSATEAASLVGTEAVQEGSPVGHPETTTFSHWPWPRGSPEHSVL